MAEVKIYDDECTGALLVALPHTISEQAKIDIDDTVNVQFQQGMVVVRAGPAQEPDVLYVADLVDRVLSGETTRHSYLPVPLAYALATTLIYRLRGVADRERDVVAERVFAFINESMVVELALMAVQLVQSNVIMMDQKVDPVRVPSFGALLDRFKNMKGV